MGENELSLDGSLVHDGHAEIITKRAFILYLMHHLEKAYDVMDGSTSDAENIFEYCETSKQFHLNDGVRFHFYSSYPPCGDATIAPKMNKFEDNSILNTDDPSYPAKKKIRLESIDEAADIHRTGAKCVDQCMTKDPQGLSTSRKHFHTLGAVRTKPGRGDPSRSLSCSDKMSKWNFVGLQGSFVSSLLSNGPIIWSSLIFGSDQLNLQSVYRSLYSRFTNQDNVLEPIPIIKSTIPFQYAKEDKLETSKIIPCSSNLAFARSEDNIICHDIMVNGRKQGITKKHYGTIKAKASICRANISMRFVQLLKKIHACCSDKHICDTCQRIQGDIVYSKLKINCQNHTKWFKKRETSYYEILPGLKEARRERRKRLDDFLIG